MRQVLLRSVRSRLRFPKHRIRSRSRAECCARMDPKRARPAGSRRSEGGEEAYSSPGVSRSHAPVGTWPGGEQRRLALAWLVYRTASGGPRELERISSRPRRRHRSSGLVIGSVLRVGLLSGPPRAHSRCAGCSAPQPGSGFPGSAAQLLRPWQKRLGRGGNRGVDVEGMNLSAPGHRVVETTRRRERRPSRSPTSAPHMVIDAADARAHLMRPGPRGIMSAGAATHGRPRPRNARCRSGGDHHIISIRSRPGEVIGNSEWREPCSARSASWSSPLLDVLPRGPFPPSPGDVRALCGGPRTLRAPG